ncbi:hypothetical protein GCM10023347_41350 [Streptomyces chumphonensis]
MSASDVRGSAWAGTATAAARRAAAARDEDMRTGGRLRWWGRPSQRKAKAVTHQLGRGRMAGG